MFEVEIPDWSEGKPLFFRCKLAKNWHEARLEVIEWVNTIGRLGRPDATTPYCMNLPVGTKIRQDGRLVKTLAEADQMQGGLGAEELQKVVADTKRLADFFIDRAVSACGPNPKKEEAYNRALGSFASALSVCLHYFGGQLGRESVNNAFRAIGLPAIPPPRAQLMDSTTAEAIASFWAKVETHGIKIRALDVQDRDRITQCLTEAIDWLHGESKKA